jgi:hypothetical protein
MGEQQFPSYLVKTGRALADHCNQGTEREALNTLYSNDCVSVEALSSPNGREVKGLDAIRAKHDWWQGAFEEHESRADGPFFHAPNRFTLIFHMDVTEKDSGQRTKMSEIGEYTVNEDGQIVREAFFYAIPDASSEA